MKLLWLDIYATGRHLLVLSLIWIIDYEKLFWPVPNWHDLNTLFIMENNRAVQSNIIMTRQPSVEDKHRRREAHAQQSKDDHTISTTTFVSPSYNHPHKLEWGWLTTPGQACKVTVLCPSSCFLCLRLLPWEPCRHHRPVYNKGDAEKSL